MTIGEPDERFGQPIVRVDAVQLAALDEGGDHRPVVAAFVRAGEQGILPVQSDRPDGSLDGVAVEIDAAVVDEVAEAVPSKERVADRLAELALGADLAKPALKILVQLVDDGPATLTTSNAPLFRRQ